MTNDNAAAGLRLSAASAPALQSGQAIVMFRAIILIVLAGACLWGQDAGAPAVAPTPPRPVLENNGKPMLVPFRCTDEDIHRAGLSCSEEEPCATFLELSAVAAVGN